MQWNGFSEEKDRFTLGLHYGPGAPGFQYVDEANPADAPVEVEEAEIKAAVSEHNDDAIKLYLREIQKSKLLSSDEEKELAVRIGRGDKAARDRMIECNLRLVVKFAKRYLNRGLPFLDLIEEGNMGLIKAVERYKLDKECRFSTYATWWIRQTIERALVNQSRMVRLPAHISYDINKMHRAARDLVKKIDREPTGKEVADALGVDVAYVYRLTVLMRKTYSLERPMGEHNDYSLTYTVSDVSAVSPEELLEEQDKYELVSRLSGILNEGERKILALRYGLDDNEPQTLDSIGRIFGVTRERIRQIEKKAIGKLRDIVGATDVIRCGARTD